MRPHNTAPLIIFSITALTSVGLAQATVACFAGPDESRQLSIQLGPDVSREIYTAYYRNEGGEDNCTASLQVSFSSFPTSSLATRPADIAAVLREVVEEWDLDNCTVRVWYDNDTKEEFAEHELCLVEEFSFDKGAYWSASAERYCWDPRDFEILEENEIELDSDVEVEEIA